MRTAVKYNCEVIRSSDRAKRSLVANRDSIDTLRRQSERYNIDFRRTEDGPSSDLR